MPDSTAKAHMSLYNISYGTKVQSVDKTRIHRLKSYYLMVPLGEKQKLLLSIFIVTPFGFVTKFYSGPAAAWVNNSLGGVFYVIFWCFVVALFLPKVRSAAICTTVLAVTCLLEVMQLWNPPILAWLRGSFVGKTLLGTTFVWSDFAYYIVGAVVAWLWLVTIRDPNGFGNNR